MPPSSPWYPHDVESNPGDESREEALERTPM
jgi:hypothetical protein